MTDNQRLERLLQNLRTRRDMAVMDGTEIVMVETREIDLLLGIEEAEDSYRAATEDIHFTPAINPNAVTESVQTLGGEEHTQKCVTQD